MKTLHFTTRRKTKLLLSQLFCVTLSANEPSSYDWAYGTREAIQQVPHYTELATQQPEQTVESSEATEDEWPWGTPKTLLNPIEKNKSTR